jgi:hypothetical protein
MVLARCSVLALAALPLLACADNELTTAADPLDDLAPSFARKEKVREPVIQEFWVVRGEDTNDPDILHVVVSDNVHTVNPSVVYDYFHNGIVDDDPPYDQHYEYYTTGPAGAVVEDLGDGWAHVDIPWDGRVHDDNETLLWPDHLSIEIPGEGDPYTFLLSLLDAQGNTLDRARPRGVVVEGVETGLAEIDLSESDYDLRMGPNHYAGEVRSYATFKGPTAADFVSLSELSMTGLVCEKERVTTGKGKNQVVEYRYRLTAQISVVIAGAPSEDHLWWEGNFRSIDGDVLSPRMSGMEAVTDATATAVMPTEWNGEGDVEFVVDWLFPSDPSWSFVYDPWANVPLTTAGFDGATWGDVYESHESSRSGLLDGMAVPVAHSNAFNVTCR